MFTRISSLTIIILLFCLFSVEGQYRRYKSYEFHVGVGATNVFGDLGGGATSDNLGGLKDIQFSQTRPTLYLAGRLDLSEAISAKLNVFAGMTAGNDNGSKNEGRNYSFTGWQFEVSGQLEWNFVRTTDCIGSLLSRKHGRLGSAMMTRVYLFAGAGMVYASTELDTHGRNMSIGEYSKNSTAGLVVPFGLGVRSDISPYWAVGLELGRRFCTSDYLDGFTSDWSSDKDIYYLTTLHLIYKIQYVGGRRRPSRPGRR